MAQDGTLYATVPTHLEGLDNIGVAARRGVPPQETRPVQEPDALRVVPDIPVACSNIKYPVGKKKKRQQPNN